MRPVCLGDPPPSTHETRPPGGAVAGRRPGKFAGAMDGPPSVQLVPEVATRREHHRNAGGIGGSDYFRVPL